MLIGYARVSTGDQSLTLQIDALKEEGCERVYQVQISGIANSDRISIRHLISLDP